MRTGKALLQATRTYAVEDPFQSWCQVLWTGLLLLVSVAGTLWVGNPVIRLACSVATGLMLLRFFVIYHDHQHQAILPKSRLAEVMMRMFGILALSPTGVWQSSHNHHHNHNSKLRGSHIGSFPIMTREQYRGSSRVSRVKYLMMRHPLTILFGYVFIFLGGMCLYPFVNSPGRNLDSLIALVIHLLLGLSLAWFLGWQTLLFTQTFPHFVASALGSYLFYAQHNFPSVRFLHSGGWTYEGAALESSSCMRMGWFMRWVTANIGYHHLHHLNARIPFYRLPEVMRAIPEVQNPKTTSLHPTDIVRCLRLKVWDVEAQRMVSLRSALS